MYQVAQLKKMNTERLHKLFQKVLGYSLFNPYVERSLMIVLLNQKFNPPKEKHQTVVNVIALIDKTCETVSTHYNRRVSDSKRKILLFEKPIQKETPIQG